MDLIFQPKKPNFKPFTYIQRIITYPKLNFKTSFTAYICGFKLWGSKKIANSIGNWWHWWLFWFGIVYGFGNKLITEFWNPANQKHFIKFKPGGFGFWNSSNQKHFKENSENTWKFYGTNRLWRKSDRGQYNIYLIWNWVASSVCAGPKTNIHYNIQDF